jgi:hypothetical protein
MRNRKNLPTRSVRRPATVGLARPNNKIVVVSAPDPYVFGLQDPHPDPLVISTDPDLTGTFSPKSVERTEITVAK